MPKVFSGISFPDKWNELNCQLWLFLYGNKLYADPYYRPPEFCEPNPAPNPYLGEGRFEHFRLIVESLFPKSFEWNEWATMTTRAFCEEKYCCVSGCAGSGKSTAAAMYALIWYLAGPQASGIMIVSTTIEAAKRRIWKPLRAYYMELVKMWRRVGNTTLVNSPKPAIRYDEMVNGNPTATTFGIHVVAVAKGEEQKGIDSLKGFHPARLMMIVDEADAVSQAVVDVRVNQMVGKMEYQSISLGNDPSLFNPLGRLMAPALNKAVGLEHKDWRSAEGMRCLRLDGYETPNLSNNDKWNGIMKKRDLEAAIAKWGDNTPQAWIMLRGLHPPDGCDNTVVSESLLVKNNVRDSVVWKGIFTESAMLDPAFGGDGCVLRFMRRGLDTDNILRVCFTDIIEIPINASDRVNPPEYQIASAVMSKCKARGIKPEEFIMDATGTGRGVASILKREWSPLINECEFGGSASSMPVSDENPIPANEEYDRHVTELWFSFREFVEAGMIRGLDEKTCVEFCQRRWEIKNKKKCLEKKEDLKARGMASPDRADALSTGLDLLRRKGIYASVKTTVKSEAKSGWDKWEKEHDIDAEDTYSPDMMPMDVY